MTIKKSGGRSNWRVIEREKKEKYESESVSAKKLFSSLCYILSVCLSGSIRESRVLAAVVSLFSTVTQNMKNGSLGLFAHQEVPFLPFVCKYNAKGKRGVIAINPTITHELLMPTSPLALFFVSIPHFQPPVSLLSDCLSVCVVFI